MSSLESLPLSLLHCLLLEWLSPKSVCTAARASGTLRRAALSAPVEFRVADKEHLREGCIRWFREKELSLRLWATVHTNTRGVFHFYNGRLHRDGDLPAILWADGARTWYQHGNQHRDGDQPAHIGEDGARTWYQHGMPHRDDDLPAYMGADGTQSWWKHGLRHRDDDKPASISANGTLGWYEKGVLWRTS